MAATATSVRDTLARIIEMQPGTEAAARAHHDLGRWLLEHADIEGATRSFRQVLPQWERWHSLAGFEIARIYETHVRDLGAAEREYRKVIRRHPESFAAARSYARMADLYDAAGDPITAENMRDCALRAFGRVLDTSEDEAERSEALERFIDACRKLERWEPAVDALIKSRRDAVRRRDVARRVEIDRQLGDIYLQREQHGNALVRFRACLQHARRRGDLSEIVTLTERVAGCQRAGADVTGVRRTYQALVSYMSRGGEQRWDAHRDAKLAPAIVRAYLAADRAAEAKRVRTRLSRYSSADARLALSAVDAELAAVLTAAPR